MDSVKWQSGDIIVKNFGTCKGNFRNVCSERERENFICHNIAKTNNNTNGEYVVGCQKRLKAHRAGDQKREKNLKTQT